MQTSSSPTASSIHRPAPFCATCSAGSRFAWFIFLLGCNHGGHDLMVHRSCWKPLFILCDFPQTSSSGRGSHPWGLGQIYGDPPPLEPTQPWMTIILNWVSLSYPLGEELGPPGCPGQRGLPCVGGCSFGTWFLFLE